MFASCDMTMCKQLWSSEIEGPRCDWIDGLVYIGVSAYVIDLNLMEYSFSFYGDSVRLLQYCYDYALLAFHLSDRFRNVGLSLSDVLFTPSKLVKCRSRADFS